MKIEVDFGVVVEIVILGVIYIFRHRHYTSGDINKFGQAFDSLLEYWGLVNCEADRAVGTYFHTLPTAAASVLDLGSPVYEFDRFYKANAFGAISTSTTKIRHSDGHAGQFMYLAADLGGDVGKRTP